MTPAAERELHLRALAASAERRNRPTALPVIAAALLMAAFAFAGWSVKQARDARTTLEEATTEGGEVTRMVAQIKAVRDDPGRKLDQQKYKPEQKLLGKLATIHEKLGLASKPPTISEGGRFRPLALDSPLTQRSVHVTLNDWTMEQAMQWINSALRETPGLQVSGVEIKPGAHGWSIDLDLARWELKQ